MTSHLAYIDSAMIWAVPDLMSILPEPFKEDSVQGYLIQLKVQLSLNNGNSGNQLLVKVQIKTIHPNLAWGETLCGLE